MALRKPAYNRWDIVKVPFPFTEGAGDKRRPALVVSSKALGQEHGFYWLVMITSAINNPWTGDVVIDDLMAAGLSAASVIRTSKITTLQEDRILGRLGHLNPKKAMQVEKALALWLQA